MHPSGEAGAARNFLVQANWPVWYERPIDSAGDRMNSSALNLDDLSFMVVVLLVIVAWMALLGGIYIYNTNRHSRPRKPSDGSAGRKSKHGGRRSGER